MNLATLLFAVLMATLPVENGYSQKPFLKNYTIDDGLPSNEIYQVLQDDSDNLLVATDRGAMKFDGYSFKNISVDDQQPSIPFYYLYKSGGLIYFSGLKGSLYHYNNNRLSIYLYSKKVQAIFKHPGLLIANTLSLHNDSLWISYNNDYNYNFNIGSCIVLPGGEIKQIKKHDGIYFDLYRNFFYRQLADTNSHEINQPVFINWPDGSSTKDTLHLSWESGYIRRLFHVSVEGYDVFCMGRKVHIYWGKKKTSVFSSQQNILFLTVIANRIYMGLENGGVTVYTIEDGAFKQAVPNFLEGITVNCVYKDDQGGIWFSTQENGLYYSHPSGAQYSESKNKITDITKIGNSVYVGYTSGLIQLIDGNKIIQQFKLPLSAGNNPVTFSRDKNDSLIAITYKGFYVKHSSGWKFYPQPRVHLLTVGADKLYLAAADYAELYTYSGLGGRLLFKTELQKRIISMLNDKNGRLWMGTWEGLYVLDKFKLKNLTAESSIFNDRIIGIKEFPDTSIVIASLRNGIAVIKNGYINTLPISNESNPSVINSMEVDNDDIWLGTNKGLIKVSYKNKRFTIHNFGIDNGLPTADIHQFAVVNRILYLKWINRLVIISIDSLFKPAVHSKIKINSVFVNDVDVINKQSRFNYKENTFVFHYNSINLSSANQQVYYYMLQGFDVKWSVTKDRMVKYNNLPHGNYIFKVKTNNATNSDNTAVYQFSIEPAYWQRWWFPILIGLLLLSATILVFQKRINSIRKKNSLYLDLAESQQKALVQLVNPHFIFNILNTLQSAILKQDKIKAATLVSQFAKLMRMTLDLNKEKFVSLQKEIDMLSKYFELELIRNDNFSYHIQLDPQIDASAIYIPPMLIQPFVENAIKHGISALPGGNGQINIKVMYREKYLLCSVQDNGIGRERSGLINANKHTRYGSSGIEITLKRLSLLHKENGSSYQYEVIDNKDSLGNPRGTTIIFSIPFKLSL